MSQYVSIGIRDKQADTIAVPPSDLNRHIIRLESITVAWMVIECGVSLASAKAAGSPALLAFGSDSLVEVLSAVVVLLPLMPSFKVTKRKASRMAGILLLVLAAVVALTATFALIFDVRPEASLAGIAITVAALAVMPVLAWKKRLAARAANDRALAADAVQSATCAYLAGVTLLGLSVNALFHLPWIDSAAALIAIPILLVEARRALSGESCSCY